MISQIIDALEYDYDKASGQPTHGPGMAISPRSGAGSNAGADEHYRQTSQDSTASGPGAGELSSTSGQSVNGQHTFKIITTKRSLLLSAPSEEEEIKWLSAVRAVIARRGTAPSNATPTPSASTSVSPPPLNGGSTGVEGMSRVSLSGMGRKRSASGTSAIAPH